MQHDTIADVIAVFDIETIQLYLEGFSRFALDYPFLAMPIALIAIVGVLHSFYRAYRELIENSKAFLRDRSRPTRIGFALLFACLVGSSFVVTSLAARYARPAPILNPIPGRVLTKDLLIRWTPVERPGGEMTYLVSLKNQHTGEVVMEDETRLPYCVVRIIQGRLAIKVSALRNGDVWSTSKEVVTEIYPNWVERLQATSRLVVGVHTDRTKGAFCYLDERDGWSGFDIDLINYVTDILSKRFGVENLKPDFRYYPWPEIFEAPRANDVDIIIASISRTDERQRKYDLIFSDPYFETHLLNPANYYDTF